MIPTKIRTLLKKLDKLTNWQATILIALFGFVAYFDGLQNQFLGDDDGQIVNNPVVHSLSHFKLFFTGGTFYNGQGISHLTGVYFRPLQTTVYSFIYTVFGSQPNFFHLIQLLLCIGSTIILYLIFRYSFKPALALCLSLIFLLHPINSQTVFAIANMQDALYFFFGIAALWLLIRFKSTKGLVLAAICLFLALLSKEAGFLFIVMSVIYLFWYNRKRLYLFLGMMLVPIVIYIVLREHAIGWFTNPNDVPIDRTNLIGRLFTAPSIMLFYITKFIFPWKLASAYYWVYPTFSVRHFLLPLILDLAVMAVIVYLAFVIRLRTSRQNYIAYLFFTIWAAIGLASLLQIFPLDFTASEPWFRFSMVGILGLIGIVIKIFAPAIKLNRTAIFAFMAIVVLLLGIRTALRGRDWSSPYKLYSTDLRTSNEDFEAYYQMSIYYYNTGDYYSSKVYAAKSVAMFPWATNYSALGAAYYSLGDYPDAYRAYINGLNYLNYCEIYDNMSVLTHYYGNPYANQKFLISAINHCPADATPWLYLAVLDYTYQNVSGAKYAITKAYNLGSQTNSSIPSIYNAIMNNQSLNASN